MVVWVSVQGWLSFGLVVDVAHQQKLKARREEIALEGLETLSQGWQQRDQEHDRIAETQRTVGSPSTWLSLPRNPTTASSRRLTPGSSIGKWPQFSSITNSLGPRIRSKKG